jgi:5-methylthioadenosine/S-adenosylhomocysteine deaminase
MSEGSGTGSVLVRDGFVLRPDGSWAAGDVLVRDGLIARVGEGLSAGPGAEVVEASGHLVMPGLVDAHRHVWLGSVAASSEGVTLPEYSRQVNEVLGDGFTAEDVYAGVLWGAVQAVSAGVTAVADWAHNLRTAEDIDANVRALEDSGIRARLFFGGKASSSGDYAAYPGQAQELHASHGGGGRITLGLALRGPLFASAEETEREFGLARELGLPVSIHAGMAGLPGTVDQLAKQGLLGPDVNYAHANEFSEREWELVAGSGGTVSATPTVDMTMGLGTHPAVGAALAHGVTVGLGADTVAYGPADLFGEMRLALAAERSRENAAAVARGEMPSGLASGYRQMLEVATLGGARVLGLTGLAGEIAPGRHADLITVDLSAPYLDGFGSPVLAAFLGAGPGDVDTVMVGGRILKRHGKLDPAILQSAREHLARSRARIRARTAA